MNRRRPRLVRGVEVIEVAIALPLVLVAVFSGLEYGWAMIRSVQIDHAARVGAREAALSGRTTADVQARVEDALERSGITGASVTVTPQDLTDLAPGTAVQVDVEVSYSNVRLIGLGGLMPLPNALRGHASMIREPDA